MAKSFLLTALVRTLSPKSALLRLPAYSASFATRHKNNYKPKLRKRQQPPRRSSIKPASRHAIVPHKEENLHNLSARGEPSPHTLTRNEFRISSKWPSCGSCRALVGPTPLRLRRRIVQIPPERY